MSPIPLGFWATAGASGGAAGSYDLISTVYGTGSSGTITLSSIPADYKHLQIRGSFKNTSTARDVLIRFNSDTSNYAVHSLRSNGSTVTSGNQTSLTNIILDNGSSNSTTADATSAVIVDILDYTNTTKNKTVRSMHGQKDSNTWIFLESGLWVNTAAVTSITLSAAANNFSTLTRVSLYGIKG